MPPFFLSQRENIINKNKQVQRLGGIGPDPGKPKREYIVKKLSKWYNSNLSQQNYTNHWRNPANPRKDAKLGYKKRREKWTSHKTVRD